MSDAVAKLQPNAEPLLRLLKQHVDDSMLREIAAADYGDGTAKHLSQIRRMIDRGGLTNYNWYPLEVLELIRWSEPEDPAWKPGARGERGHWMRLFACTWLMKTVHLSKGEYDDLGEDATLIQFVDSALKLGDDTASAALRFLAWRLTDAKDDAAEPVALAASLLAANREATVAALAEMIQLEEDDEGPALAWLSDCQNAATWRRLADQRLIDGKTSDPTDSRLRLGRAILAATC